MASSRLICLLLVFCVSSIRSLNSAKLPNIVFVLTDDQDEFLGGEIPMTKTKRLVTDQGIRFKNMFVSSPLCCPSRSTIFSGNYLHNHRTVNNSYEGNCSSHAWQNGPERQSFPVYLKSQGYNTFFAGKYLNAYGIPENGGPTHIPPGWDWWEGLVPDGSRSMYYGYALSVNGTYVRHGYNYEKDYFPDLIHREGIQFLQYQNADTPFFMMLAPPACHEPFTPAPQYSTYFSDLVAPRNGSYNVHGDDKHWLIRAAKSPMNPESVDYSDSAFINRWRTLLSVDDMVENVVNVLEQKGLLDNTYIFLSGDNGFHMGQFSLPIDKRQMYEFDVRVPLMVRGPGIAPGQEREELVSNIDFAPTFVELAGLPPPDNMDGLSMKKILLDNSNSTVPYRDTLLLEHVGEYTVNVKGCPELYDQDVIICITNCVCEDSKNNSYACLRSIDSDGSTKYCEMDDDENFVEVYDLLTDPHELKNIVNVTDPNTLQNYSKVLAELSTCAGESCHNISSKMKHKS